MLRASRSRQRNAAYYRTGEEEYVRSSADVMRSLTLAISKRVVDKEHLHVLSLGLISAAQLVGWWLTVEGLRAGLHDVVYSSTITM